MNTLNTSQSQKWNQARVDYKLIEVIDASAVPVLNFDALNLNLGRG